MGYRYTNPNDPATPGMTWALFVRTGVDVREMGLTKQQAGDMLDEPQHHNDALRTVLLKKGGVAKRDRAVGVVHVQPANGGTSEEAPTDAAATTDDAAALTVEIVHSDERGAVLELPPSLAALLPAGSCFTVQLTDDGLLLRLMRD